MKKGFTLQEILVTMAIVGIVAAIAVPGVVGNLPSREKMQFLKSYKAFTEIVADLVDDPNIYHATDDHPCNAVFDCLNQVTDINGNTLWPRANNDDSDAADKFAKFFADRVSLNGNITNVGTTWQFTTIDNVLWQFSTNGSGLGINININVTGGQDNRWDISMQLDNDGGISFPQVNGSSLGQQLLNQKSLKNKDVKTLLPPKTKDKT